jgi:hypothetical protein
MCLRFAPFILVFGLLAGCATSQPKYTALNDGSGLEKKQSAPTDDMTTGQKIASHLGWSSSGGLNAGARVSVPLALP